MGSSRIPCILLGLSTNCKFDKRKNPLYVIVKRVLDNYSKVGYYLTLQVLRAGIEPALRLREQDFKSCVSTSSTI